MIVDKIDIQRLDEERVQLQARLDKLKTAEERNRMGQFATPPKLALEILQTTKALLPPAKAVRFLDPAFGTGAFYAALRKTFTAAEIEQALGYEIDPHYGSAAQNLWRGTALQLELQDFTQLAAPVADHQKATVLICNPPYVRHHHLSSHVKSHLKKVSMQATGIELSGLSGLYCYFLLFAHHWLAEDGIACWLIPSEFMDVNYGQQVKKYLLSQVELIRIHRFDPSGTQFDDALVSSAVVWFRKRAVLDKQRKVQLSFGGTCASPNVVKQIELDELLPVQKWSNFATSSKTTLAQQNERAKQLCLSDLFDIKRGVATGANDFFILTAAQAQALALPLIFLAPILPSPRYITCDEVETDDHGLPLITKQHFLLNCTLPEHLVRRDYPLLWQYFESGIEQGIDQRYLCRHRSPWYAQDKRSPSPFLCTYMGRSEQPFRFILNHSQAIAANVYLMLYPKQILQTYIDENPSLIKKIWLLLCQIEPSQLIAEGRVYGGGLHKLEPKELSNASVTGIQELIPNFGLNGLKQMSLFS